jgi:hypothetical protein
MQLIAKQAIPIESIFEAIDSPPLLKRLKGKDSSTATNHFTPLDLRRQGINARHDVCSRVFETKKPARSSFAFLPVERAVTTGK